MKICIISDMNSAHVIRWTGILKSRNHDVIVISSTPGWQPIKGVKVYGCYSQNFKNKFKKLYHELYRAIEIKNIVAKIRPDIVHIHSLDYIHPLLFGIVKVIFNKFNNLVVSTWGTDVTGVEGINESWRSKLSKKFLLNQAETITATTHYLAEATALLAANKKKIHVVPFGIDCRVFQKRKNKHSKTNGALRVGFVKHLKAKYGPDYFIKSMSEVIKLYPDTRIIMVGKGEMEIELKELASSLGLNDNIKFLGHVNYKRIPDIMDNLDILVMPSVRESFGVAAIEALAMEVPVVASNSGGIPEAVVHQTTGLLVEPKNIEKLALSIIELIENPELRDQMGKAGREFVFENYNLKNNVLQMENIYQDLLNSNENDS